VIVIFTARTAGNYALNGQWYGSNPQSATNGGDGPDVHVTSGLTSLFNGVSNYGSPADFDISSATLGEGQKVEFAMGYNTANDYYGGTNFSAIITATPEPSLYGFLGLGLAGLGMVIRRRRA
jgi:hypothetical protein